MREQIVTWYTLNNDHPLDDNRFYDIVISFVKMLLCPYNYSNCSYKECKDCNLCGRIANGNYTEIKIIESDNLVIKKEQLLELQSDFSRVRLEGKYLIYVIYQIILILSSARKNV